MPERAERIAKTVGWHKGYAIRHPGILPPFVQVIPTIENFPEDYVLGVEDCDLCWLDGDGQFKAWVDSWDPEHDTCDALIALMEWFEQDRLDRRGAMTFGSSHYSCELQWRVGVNEGEWYLEDDFRAIFGRGNFCEAICNAVQKWDDETKR